MPYPTKKLSDILETCDAGVWGKPAMSGKGLFILRSTNMTNDGHLDFSDVAKRKIEGDIKKVKLSDGDILVEKSGGGPDQPVGRVAHFTAPNDRAYSFANFIQRLRVKSKLIDSRFLFYRLLFLHKIGFTKKLQSQTTGIRNLKLSLYLKTEIPVPALNIQKQIVERLDKIAEAQKLSDGLIQKSDELFQSLLHQELNPVDKSWEIKSIGEVCKIIGGGTPSREEIKHFKGDIPWVTVKDLHVLEIEDTLEHINKDALKNSAANLVPANTILVATRVGLGKVAIAKKPLTFNQDIKGLKANDGVDANYLFYTILKNASKIEKNGKGATVKGVTQEFLKSIKIPLPPLATQKQIVAKLSAVQDYKTQLLAQKSKLKELFNSALAKSFNE